MRQRFFAGLFAFAIVLFAWMAIAGLYEHQQDRRIAYFVLALISASAGLAAFRRART